MISVGADPADDQKEPDATAKSVLVSGAWLGVLFVVAVAAVYLSLQFTREVGQVAALWPLNAIVIALLVRRYAQARFSILATVFVANAVTSLAIGDAARRGLGLPFANVVEIAVCAHLLFKPGERFDISKATALRRFILAGVGPIRSLRALALVCACLLAGTCH